MKTMIYTIIYYAKTTFKKSMRPNLGTISSSVFAKKNLKISIEPLLSLF